MTNHGMKPLTIPLTGGDTMAKASIQTTIERTAHPDFQVHQRPTPNQATPSNFRQQSGWTMFRLQSAVRGHNPYDNMYL
jgi:hypothetical protein